MPISQNGLKKSIKAALRTVPLGFLAALCLTPQGHSRLLDNADYEKRDWWVIQNRGNIIYQPREERCSNVIYFEGKDASEFRLHTPRWKPLKSGEPLVFRWSMKYDKTYKIQLNVLTDSGMRFLAYKPETTYKVTDDTYIDIGLGTESADNQWHSIERDVIDDVNRFWPDVQVTGVQSVMFKGTGYVDDIYLLSDYVNNERLDIDLSQTAKANDDIEIKLANFTVYSKQCS